MKDIAVKKGETLDFVVEPRTNEGWDSYTWAPEISMNADGAEKGVKTAWLASTEFSGPPGKKAERMKPWEKYAQVLMSSNEFVFVD
jgi:hypothetical protein